MKGTFAAAAVVAAYLLAPSRGVPATPDALGVGDVVNLESAGGFDVSRDGHWIVWVKTTPDKKHNDRRGSIYLTDAGGTATVQLTRGDSRDSAPRVSPDGGRVAFKSARGEKAKAQIYILDLRGGEPEKVTGAQNGVEDFDWLDGHTLVYSAREDSTWRERRLAEKKDDTIVVADQEHYPPVRLFTADLKLPLDRRVRRLTTNDGVVLEFALSPDGRRIVTNENQDIDYEYDYDHPPRQFLVDTTTGERREICAEPHVDPFAFQWDAAGEGFYCKRETASDSTDTFVGIETLWYFDAAADSLRRVPLRWTRGLGRDYTVVSGGLVVALADGVTDRIAHVTRSGDGYRVRLVDTPRAVRLAGGNRYTDRVVYETSDASTPPRIMTATVEGGAFGGAHRLAEVNRSLDGKALAQTSIVHWAGARGDSVDGILYYPLGYDESRRYPLVMLIHGGPSGHDPDFFTERWSNYPHVLAGRGALVLRVNYHGSGNYGLEWVESIKGHYYELEVPDILAGVDYLVATGLADSTRVGIMGWSNGSILAIACCLESDRFKALCAGAGDVNWTSDYGNCAFGSAFDDAYFGGPPWEKPEVYLAKSPLFRMKDLKTPTLIMFGSKDTSVPTEQGWEHFRAMQKIGAAPVRFLLFPGSPHGLSKLSQQRRKMDEELAWFDRYLFGRAQPAKPPISDAAPLARAIALATAARVGSLVGVESEATLIPEVVPMAGVEVGRFEVTRAQFAAFDPTYTYPSGTDNYPATEVSLPVAQAYCLWLSKLTGKTYRLPTTVETDSLLSAARSTRDDENTIEYWVGYTPTPDEMGALQAAIDSLETTRLLVQPVGSFAPTGGDGGTGVYDIGGNAAEWAVGDGGQGVLRGGSAVTSRDERGRVPARTPFSYVGFRVIRE